MYRIIYLSSAVNPMNDFELDELLLKAKDNNLRNNISGILLHIDGDFLQVLEGEKQNVIALFDKIKHDPRHQSILTVIEVKIQNRQFIDWSMGYKSTKYQEINKIEALENFDRKTLFETGGKTVMIFLETFLNSHKNMFSFV